MITLSFKTTIAAGLLGVSSLASAHAGNHVGGDLFHFLASPDHAAALALLAPLALASLAVGLRRKSLPASTRQIGKD